MSQWEADERERLDRFLAARFPGISRTRIERMIAEQGVLVDGERQSKPGLFVRKGQTVEAEPPGEEPPHALAPVTMDLTVVWEDAHMLVVDKPRGLAVHPAPTDGGAPTLVHGLLARGQGLSEGSAEYRPGIVHRLDKETTGLMVVAKSNAAHAALADQIAAKSAERRYFAGVINEPAHEVFTINAPLGRHPSHPLKRAIRADGKEAITHIWRAARLPRGALLACRLETGRTHQIRVHLAGCGLPVRGDFLYAPEEWRAGPMQLHAAWLAVNHPATGERIELFSAPPADFEGAELATRNRIDPWIP